MSRRLPLLALAGSVLRLSSIAAAQEVPSIDATVRAAVLDRVHAELIRLYVDADTGRRIAAVIRERQRAGIYDTLNDPRRFAQAVSADLRSVNNDKHLGLMYRPPMAPGGTMVMRGPSDAAEQDRQSQRGNYGLRRLEILEGNIGYLDIAGFMEAPGYEAAIASAMRFLERTDAIIIDVRRNGGGSGDMSHLLFSHFLAETPVPTIRVRNREDGTNTVMQSLGTVPGPRRPTVPLYVLTSNFSASAAEEFAFVLRNLNRATLVGERTAGAGHMNQINDMGNNFRLSVSYTRVSDARTGAEWEQVGVEPHIAVKADSALQTAHEHARQRLSRPA